MQNIIYFLNYFGLPINMNDNTNPLALIAFGFLIFNLIALFSLINISLYLISLYIINTNKYIDVISSKYPYLQKIIKYYNTNRTGFIILEHISLFVSIDYMIYIYIKILILLQYL